jgi:hypothetical protein
MSFVNRYNSKTVFDAYQDLNTYRVWWLNIRNNGLQFLHHEKGCLCTETQTLQQTVQKLHHREFTRHIYRENTALVVDLSPTEVPTFCQIITVDHDLGIIIDVGELETVTKMHSEWQGTCLELLLLAHSRVRKSGKISAHPPLAPDALF